MKSDKFKKRIEVHIARIEHLINKMPYKGDSSLDSQKLHLIEALNKFKYAINSTEESDFFDDFSFFCRQNNLDKKKLSIDENDCITIDSDKHKTELINRYSPHQGNIETYLTEKYEEEKQNY